VRSVLWNHELPWLLISGGDDSTLAAWDIRKNQLIYETIEPSISISSMTTHPLNPFTLITSHLDNSLIFWDLLLTPDIFHAQLKFSLPEFQITDVIADPQDLMNSVGYHNSGRLSGEGSK
jgi:WD40 repeat protein